jgi:DNA repair exonuclease SbcCD ATPase subunit
MNIQRIKIYNFKSIYETLELDFNEIKGFWKISGPVGSGKTSIGEAIIFGLFGSVSGKNNSDLISWGQKHGMIELWCTSKGRNIYIKRELNTYGQSPIYVEVDGEEVIFPNKRNAQDMLEKEYFDTSKTTMELLCIISFNNFKSLATLNTQDTKKFLDQVLGFYILTQYADICKELKSNNAYEISKIKSEISKIKSLIDKLTEISNIDIIEDNSADLKHDILMLENDIKKIEGDCMKEIAELQSNIQKTQHELSTLIALGKNKAKEISFIEKGTCPTCGAPIDQSQLNTKKQEQKILRDQYKSRDEHIRILTEQISQISSKMNNSIYSKKELVKSHKNTLIRLEEQTKRLKTNIDQIDNLKNNIDQLDKILLSYQQEDILWQQLYDILSTDIRIKILESFIPILNKNIINYTQRLQQPYIVQFDRNFKCSINLYGYEKPIPISSLSTGQLKTIDMIIILGVLGTIIGSSSTNIMFLDELFSNLDSDLRNEMCLLLKENIGKDNTLFIISHQDLDESYFNGHIDIKLIQNGSFEKKSLIKIKKS